MYSRTRPRLSPPTRPAGASEIAPLFHKHKIHGADHAESSPEVVPAQRFFHVDNAEGNKDGKRDDLLNDFQLHQIEGTSVFDESDSIGRHLSAIFEECDSPGEEDHYDQRPA